MELMIGEKLRKLRRDRDMTQEMLASAFGVSPQAISKWECGDGYPEAIRDGDQGCTLCRQRDD